MDRSAWLAERRLGIGGSDCASMFNMGYGCRRRLWYDKTGMPEDYPREQTPEMEIGVILESYFARRFQKATGFLVEEQPHPRVHAQIPELRANLDRLIRKAASSEDGVLEIKSMGRAMFYKTKREGLPEDYALQLQHAMLAAGTAWGAFAIGSRDSGDLMHWEVAKDESLASLIEEEVPKFWALVENGPAPERLEPDDRRCQRCEWRRSCQGNTLIQIEEGGIEHDESLLPLLSQYGERAELFAQAEELLEETKEELKSALGDRQAVLVGDRKVYYRPQAPRTTYNGKELALEYQKVLQRLVDALDASVLRKYRPVDSFKDTSKPSRPLRIY